MPDEVAKRSKSEQDRWVNGYLKSYTRWRLLTIGIGTDHYEARAVRIGDWKGAQQAIEAFFSCVQKLVEVDLAVGSLVYRDAEVAVFSFPGKREGTTPDLKVEHWESFLQAEADRFAGDSKLETPPYCKISKPSRSLIRLTRESRSARQTMEVPIHRGWGIAVEDDRASQIGHVCPVCLVRLTGDRNDKQRPCSVCGDRRRGRLDAWLEGKLGNETIWIDEVTDANDRVALLTFGLNIEPWLEGERLDSLRAQSIAEWRRYNPVLEEYWQRDRQRRNQRDNPIDYRQGFDKAVYYISDALRAVKANQYRIQADDLVLANFHEAYRHESDWPTFFRKIVEDRADAPAWEDGDDQHRAQWLAHQLFRKLPSPGRVYRFWRQTEEFFQDRLQEFREIVARHPNRWRVRRLVVVPDLEPASPWQDRETYSARWRDAPLELLYRRESQDFLTICNLARLLRPEERTRELVQFLKDLAELKLRDDKGQESRLRVKDVKDPTGSLGVYEPIVTVELSPLRFRVLVPLEAAMACVNRVIDAWEQEFGRVWDRLPLRVGVVAFPRMMPFQAVIEATRNLEDKLYKEGEKPESWRVAEVGGRDGVAALRLVRPRGEQECRLVPVRLPDGREDGFYAYVAVEDARPRFPRDFQHPNGPVYRHVTDLRPGDGIAVYPARVATLFLETSAARFEQTNVWYIADWKAMQEVWALVERTAPSQTALRGVWSELEACLEAWRNADGAWLEGGDQAWLDLATATLSVRLAARGAALDALVEAARTGLLKWALEWHLRVLEERVEGGRS